MPWGKNQTKHALINGLTSATTRATNSYSLEFTKKSEFNPRTLMDETYWVLGFALCKSHENHCYDPTPPVFENARRTRPKLRQPIYCTGSYIVTTRSVSQYSYCGFESWLCSELSAKQYVAVKLVTAILNHRGTQEEAGNRDYNRLETRAHIMNDCSRFNWRLQDNQALLCS